MFISGTFGLVFLRKGLVFWAFLEHDPKPFPFGCACPTEGYFLMGPRQAAAGSGRGRAGRGRECHLRPRTTLPTSPSPHPPPRVGAHLPEEERPPPPPPLQSPDPVPRRSRPVRPGWAELRRRALPVSTTGQLDWPASLPPVRARTGGEIGGISSSAPLPTFPCFAISTFIHLLLLLS